jgi:hypothetical protein
MALNELAALMKADQKTDIGRQSLGHHTAMSARTNFALGQLSFSTNVRFANSGRSITAHYPNQYPRSLGRRAAVPHLSKSCVCWRN